METNFSRDICLLVGDICFLPGGVRIICCMKYHAPSECNEIENSKIQIQRQAKRGKTGRISLAWGMRFLVESEAPKC